MNEEEEKNTMKQEEQFQMAHIQNRNIEAFCQVLICKIDLSWLHTKVTNMAGAAVVTNVYHVHGSPD